MYESFYVSHGGLVPVKWTAPEVTLPKLGKSFYEHVGLKM